MTDKTKVAIIGSGNIGTDLMIKVLDTSEELEMAALVGIPPLSGFWGKAWIILAGVQSGSILVYVTVGALVVNSVLSVPYYFGIIRNMFFEEPVTGAEEPKGLGAAKFSVYALALATTLFIFFIGPLAALVGASGLL